MKLTVLIHLPYLSVIRKCIVTICYRSFPLPSTPSPYIHKKFKSH